MKNKRVWLGMLVTVLVFGACVVGCSTGANYYTLGNVSEDNYALVNVSRVDAGQHSNAGGWVEQFVKIDGQDGSGDGSRWVQNYTPIIGGEAIVRVTPGPHTFTVNYISKEKAIFPVSITYNCKAGMGYSFGLGGQNTAGGAITVEITIFEEPIDKNGKFGGSFSLLPRVAGTNTATFYQ